MSYYSRRSFHSGNEYARRHLEEAEAFSKEIGGTDKDVKNYFFSLPYNELNEILKEYGKKFGSSPESYARETFDAWRTGRRGMSGLVAKRLFDLLPPRMPLEKKYELADNIWRYYGPTTVNYYTINQSADINELSRIIGDKLDSTVTIYNIPQNIKNRFKWLSSGDITVEETLLNYFRQQQKSLVLYKLRTEIPILQRQLQNHSDKTGLIKSELQINNNKIIITLVADYPKTIEETQIQYYKPSASKLGTDTDFSWVLLIIGAIIVYLFFIK